jgi:uncharacterized protein (TIGR02452 family)
MDRKACAKDTLKIIDEGFYLAPSRGRVEVRRMVDAAVAGTKFYDLNGTVASRAEDVKHEPPEIILTRQTTLEALAELAARPGGHLGCLNFASAKNPGGGFLGGAQAQEESLARSSALYPCLLKERNFYDRNRANSSALYLDLAIFSPGVPFFRNDAGDLLEAPYCASVITCPAPNAGAIRQNEPENSGKVLATLERRGAFVLKIAALEGIKRLVLGAWGCGVFRNDPSAVAQTFARLLKPAGPFAGKFEEIIFAVYDTSKEGGTFAAFKKAFQPDSD